MSPELIRSTSCSSVQESSRVSSSDPNPNSSSHMSMSISTSSSPMGDAYRDHDCVSAAPLSAAGDLSPGLLPVERERERELNEKESEGSKSVGADKGEEGLEGLKGKVVEGLGKM